MTDTRSAPDADERLCPYCKCPLDRGYCGTCNATWWTYVASSAGPTQEQPDGLKPCPFCGERARIRSNRDWHRIVVDHRSGCFLHDTDPLMWPATDEDKAEAIAAWNRRTPDSPAAQQIGEQSSDEALREDG